jgi:hypothetical protein
MDVWVGSGVGVGVKVSNTGTVLIEPLERVWRDAVVTTVGGRVLFVLEAVLEAGSSECVVESWVSNGVV